MVHYVPVKLMINALGLTKVVIDMVVHHHGVLESIVTDWDSFFTSKFWSWLSYFPKIKQKLFTTFHSLTDGQTKKQNRIIEVYLRAFVNWEQEDWVKLLPIVEFADNNAKNASIGHIFFELNYGYHPKISFKEDVDPCSRFCSTNKLAKEVRELIEVCCQNLLYAQELQKEPLTKK